VFALADLEAMDHQKAYTARVEPSNAGKVEDKMAFPVFKEILHFLRQAVDGKPENSGPRRVIACTCPYFRMLISRAFTLAPSLNIATHLR
jgi:hypothetical protein